MKAFSRLLAVLVPVGLLLTAALLWRSHQETESAGPVSANQAAVSPVTPPVAAPTTVQKPVAPAPVPVPAAPARVLAPEMAAFEVWVGKFAGASPLEQTALAEDGMKLAEARRAAMAQLIERDPEAALRQALPYNLRKALPAEIGAVIEQPVSGRGEIKAIHIDPLPEFEGQIATLMFEAELNHQTYEAYPFGRRLGLPSRRGLWLNGISAPNAQGRQVLALSSEVLRAVDAVEASDLMVAGKLDADAACAVCGTEAPADTATYGEFGDSVKTFCGTTHFAKMNKSLAAAESKLSPAGLKAAGSAPDVLPPGNLTGTQGTKSLLFMPVLFADDPVVPISQDSLQAVAEANNRYYVEASYGTISWQTTVTPPLRLPYSKIYYGENVGQTHGDALAVAATLGYFGNDYTESYVVFNSLPQISFGGRSDGLINGGGSAGAITHELGHNLGFIHANYWNVGGATPGPVQPPNPPTPPWPIDIDSLIGHDDVNAPFIMRLGGSTSPILEYGDIYDVMGSGGGHFGAPIKYTFNWLNELQAPVLTQSSTNRIYSFDVAHTVPGRIYAVRNVKSDIREYWFSHRRNTDNNPWMDNGLQIQWLWGGSQTVLVDDTPTTSDGRNDAAVVVGRTFKDVQAGLYVTPIALGQAGTDNEYIDTVVHIGRFPTNVAPTLQIQASALAVNIGDTVNFTATANDANGDALAYYWEFGDAGFSAANAPVASKTFDNDGQYVVRCEVSDMKGGLAIAHVVVLVGDPDTVTMSGRVVDVNGQPVQGVRVHNSGSMGGTYRYGYTDSQGYYTIANIPSGVYTNRAFIYGYECVPQFFDPVDLRNGSVSDLNQLAVPITKVSIVKQDDAAEPDVVGHFTVSRTGDTGQDLKVRFATGGTAEVDIDYQPFGGYWVTNTVVVTNDDETITTNEVPVFDPEYILIPAGYESVQLDVIPINNDVNTGGTNNIIVSLLLETNDWRYTTTLTNVVTTNTFGTTNILSTNTVFITRTNRVRIPGWDLRTIGPGDDLQWVQTYPNYVLGDERAIMHLTDDDPFTSPRVSVETVDADAVETGNDTGILKFSRTGGDLNSPLVIHYTCASGDDTSGIASNGVDYVKLPGVVTIPAGEDYTLVEVKAINDLFVEGNEFAIILIAEDPDHYEVGSGVAAVSIVDDDLPVITVFASDSVAMTGGANPGRVTFSRSGDVSASLQVNYLVSGSATSSVDFVQLPGTITIPAGQITASVNLTTLNNPNFIGPRAVVIQVSDSPTYNIARQNSATVVIEPNLPLVTLTAAATDISESGGNTTLTFTRTGETNIALLVFYEVGGSAVPGQDFADIGTNILIAAGATTATVTLASINDNARENGDETGPDRVIVRLSPGANYLTGNPNAVTVAINDDEADTALPGVSFMQRYSSVREDAGRATIHVRVSANPNTNRHPVVVEYRIVSGSALPNLNYVPIPGATGQLSWLHYRANNTEFVRLEDGIREITIPVLNDGVTTSNKSFTLQLSDPRRYVTNLTYVTNSGNIITNTLITSPVTNGIVRDWFQHTVTLIDVGVNVVSIAADQQLIYETGTVGARFTVSRSGSSLASPLTVHLSTYGSAAPGNDYVMPGTNGTVTIPAGTNAVSFTLRPFDDPTEEMAEYVSVNLLQRPGYQLGSPASAQVVLVNNDGTIQFASVNFEVDEGATNALIGVQRTGETNSLARVDFRFTGGTASNGVDYLGADGTLVFAPGETFKSFAIPVLDDRMVEPNETVTLLLTNATGGAPLGGQRTATLTILDDDLSIAFVSTVFAADENGTNALITVKRSGLTTTLATVDFATADITATNGVATNGLDYLGTNITVVFNPGETNLTVLVPLLDDILFEDTESFAVRLFNPSTNATLGVLSNAVVRIADDECRIEFAADTYRVNEYAGVATVEVRRVGGRQNQVSVDFFTLDGTATNNGDYAETFGSLTFAGNAFVLTTNGGALVFVPGETSKVITIPLFDDQIGEGNEFFSVLLTNLAGPVEGALPGSAIFGSNTLTTVTIIDNETPGSVEVEFNPNGGANSRVRAVAQQSDGRTVFGGDFTEVDQITFNRIARLTVSGLLDPSFNPGFGVNSNVYAVAVGADQRIVLGGDFTTVDNVSRTRIARLNANGSLDLSFDPAGGFNGIVRAILVQPDGRVLVGGDFTTFDGATRGHLVRLQTNGLLDFTFQASVNGAVNSMARQPDGRVVIGGAFNNVNGSSLSGVARLTTGGLPDASFAPPLVLGAVRGLALQPDGRVVIGGAFASVGGQGYARLARLEANGALDTTFATGAGPDAPVNTVAAQGNGRLIIGGEFTTFNGASRNRFARLRATGALDSVFDIGTGANAPVLSALVQTNTAVVISGEFTNVNGIARGYIARIHGEEAMDITEVGFASARYEVVENAGFITLNIERFGNTNTEFSVNFTTADGGAVSPADYLATNNFSDGPLTFASGEMSKSVTIPIVDDLLVESNETFVFYVTNTPSGVYPAENSLVTVTIIDNEQSLQFSAANFNVSEGATNARISVVRRGLPVGDVSVDFSTASGTAQTDSDFLPVSAALTFTNGQTEQTVEIPILDDLLLESNEVFTVTLANPAGAFLGDVPVATVTIQDNELGPGSVDVTFTPGAGANDLVRSLALQPDGKVLVGGAFSSFAGTNRLRLARMNYDGTHDLGFNPGAGADGLVTAIGVRADGRIVVAGAFTNFNAIALNRVARLLTNGAVDLNFNRIAPFDANLSSLAVQSSGNVFVGGSFNLPSPGVVRLRNDGSADVSFYTGTGANGPVHAVSECANHTVVIAGAFTQVDGLNRRRVARLLPNGITDPGFVPPANIAGVLYALLVQPDGRVIIGGDFTTIDGASYRGIARLNANGTLDLAFNPGTGAGGIVYAVALEADGDVLIGGTFSEVAGVTRTRLARLKSNGALDLTFDSGLGPNGTVNAIVVAPDNKIVIGGNFTSVNGQPRHGVARINGDEFEIRIVSGSLALGAWRQTVQTLPGRAYVLETTTDLVSWTGVLTNTAPGFSLEMVDPTVPLPATRFYRVRQVWP